MRRLTKPTGDDEKRREALAVKDALSKKDAHRWKAAYAEYSKYLGNPFKVMPYAKTKKLKDTLYGFYDMARETIAIRAVRRAKLSTCPMCGSGSVGTVDHFLPRETYPEFSILIANLVPTCGICNTKAKKGKFKGLLAGQRFLHPYFNKVLAREIWQVGFDFNAGVVTFRAMPAPDLWPSIRRRVQWHLDNVLEEQFHNVIGTKWPDHARGLNRELAALGGGPMTEAFVRSETARLLRYEIPGDKHNSWAAAFYRGLLDDPAAVAWMVAEGPSVI